VARDDRGVTDPGVNRARFLSEFAFALRNARLKLLAHGGTIVAESEGRERGSRFVVTFPPERVVARREDGRGGKREAAR
jgi:hypothetical protein